MTTPPTVHGDTEVVGPITGARPPFGVPRLDVSDRGFVVEEFQIAGTAARTPPPTVPSTAWTVAGSWKPPGSPTTSPGCS